jgi:hypothetical protein
LQPVAWPLGSSVKYPRQESNNPAKTLGILKNDKVALQNALHFLASLDQG